MLGSRRFPPRFVDHFMNVLSARPGLVALGWLYLVLACLPARAGSLDQLDSPAPENPQATRSVLLDVTRAGDRLVAVGERGLVLTSSDNGRAWQQAKVPVSVALTRVRFTDAQQGWAVGHSGVVLHSIDGGVTWSRQLDGLATAKIEAQAAALTSDPRRRSNAERLVSEGADKPWLDLLFVDARHGWLVGAYGLLFSTDDGGATWQSRMGDIDNQGGLHLYAIRKQGDALYIVGEQGMVFQSDADGRFRRLQTPYQGSFFGLSVSDKGDLLAYGLRGNAWHRNAPTESWQQSDLGNDVTLTADVRSDDGSLLLSDESGRLSRSLDNGVTFTPLALSAKGYVAGMAETADGALIVAGGRGVQRIEVKEARP
jgi:photosystem II stability/assembly factor-like uncharacterized protein